MVGSKEQLEVVSSEMADDCKSSVFEYIYVTSDKHLLNEEVMGGEKANSAKERV
jgi:hypothetical protein